MRPFRRCLSDGHQYTAHLNARDITTYSRSIARNGLTTYTVVNSLLAPLAALLLRHSGYNAELTARQHAPLLGYVAY